MSTYPTAPTFPIDLSADPGSGILVTRQGASLKLRLDPANSGGGGASAPAAIAAGAVLPHHALRISSSGVSHYSAGDAAQFGAYVGLSLLGANVGDVVTYQQDGAIDDPSWTWIPGRPVYAADNGLLTQDEPTAGVCQAVGTATTATRILVDHIPPILL